MLFRGKLQRAQDAVKRALSELGPEDRFNVVTFSSSATRLSAQLLAPTRENLLRAFAFIDGMTLSPATNFSAGVRSVFSLASVTHVFLLSDGEPTEGTRDYAQLRAEIRQLNTAGARVLTLALGLGEQFPGIRLLQGIAEDSGGQFSYVNLR